MDDNPHMPVDISLKVTADATKPLQDITTTATNAAAFAGQVLGTPIEMAGGIVSDQIRYWRAVNLERLRSKWLQRRGARNLSLEMIKILPFDIGTRLLEAASGEDDEEVQALWAALLDAATDPNSSANVRRVHVDILKEITAVEASILRFLWLRVFLVDDHEVVRVPKLEDFVTRFLKRYSVDERAVGLQNLKRQNCIRLKLDQFRLDEVSEIDDVLGEGNVDKERMKRVIQALKILIQDVSGTHDEAYLGLHERLREKEKWDPELSFELTSLGIDLMRICEPSKEA